MKPSDVPEKKPEGAYHHGDLRRTLVAVAGEMLGETGVAGFRLREACRRAGVTIGAASHHFGSSRGLLTAVACDAFEQLCAVFESIANGPLTPPEQLVAALEGYAGLARTLPGPFSIMFRWDLIDTENAKFAAVGPRSYALLQDLVRRNARTLNSEPQILHAAETLWATIHGLVDLGLLFKEGPADGTLGEAAKAKIDYVVEAVLAALARE